MFRYILAASLACVHKAGEFQLSLIIAGSFFFQRLGPWILLLNFYEDVPAEFFHVSLSEPLTKRMFNTPIVICEAASLGRFE